MCQWKLCVLCVFNLCLYAVIAFNVDSFNYASYDMPSYDGRDSMFGFSIALHRERNTGWQVLFVAKVLVFITRLPKIAMKPELNIIIVICVFFCNIYFARLGLGHYFHKISTNFDDLLPPSGEHMLGPYREKRKHVFGDFAADVDQCFWHSPRPNIYIQRFCAGS